MVQTAPPGFKPHDRKSPLTDPWEPLFSRMNEGRFTIGLFAGEAHTNRRAFVHGGLIAALADNAMGIACARAFDPPKSMVTVSMSIDYLGAAHIGDWLAFCATPVKTGRTLCFGECLVTGNDVPVARAHATFRVVSAPH